MLASVPLANSCQKTEIEVGLLNSEIFSLYEKYSFISILEDEEYADLKQGEKYWLAIDSQHEYLTLRTVNNIIVEVIIRNPDLVTRKGLGTGDNKERLKALYPNAVKLTHYSNGVKRRGEHFYLSSENVEVNFNKKGLISSLKLKREDREDSVIKKDKTTLDDNLIEQETSNSQRYQNVLSTFSSCKGKPIAAWVLISPKRFPESFKGKYATLRFYVDDEAKPYDVELVEGSNEIAEWSTSSLMKSKFPNDQASCWIVKYEYVE